MLDRGGRRSGHDRAGQRRQQRRTGKREKPWRDDQRRGALRRLHLLRLEPGRGGHECLPRRLRARPSDGRDDEGERRKRRRGGERREQGGPPSAPTGASSRSPPSPRTWPRGTRTATSTCSCATARAGRRRRSASQAAAHRRTTTAAPRRSAATGSSSRSSPLPPTSRRRHEQRRRHLRPRLGAGHGASGDRQLLSRKRCARNARDGQGNGLQRPDRGRLQRRRCRVQHRSSTEIDATVPLGATSGPISVTRRPARPRARRASP